jgi:aminoglycoside phosphotransferase (APT) family kinase protein
MDVDGWDNSSFRIGADFTARLPSDAGYAPAVAKEHRWLPVLARSLPLPVPEPVGLGRPGCGFPRPWSVYRWLPGESASAERVRDLAGFAVDVADVQGRLWTVDTRGGPAAGAHSFGRGGPLSQYEDDVRRCVQALPDPVDRGAVLDLWRAATATPWEAEPRWFHGDMAPSNLLVLDGRLSAVIDFGTCGTGDPACDLVLAWTFLDAESRDAFRRRLAVDSGTWTRGRGWALWKALLTLSDPDHDGTVRRYGWRYSAAGVIRNVTDGS